MMIGTALAGAAVLALLWVFAISPRRADSATVKDSVAAQELRLGTAKTELASYKQSRAQYPGLLAELKRLDEAVPARGAISELLRQLQKRANVRHAQLRVAALKPSGAPTPGALTPGATAPSDGISSLPFTFTYTGRYFDLVQVLAAARKAVTEHAGDLKVDGRLVTIEGLAFEPNAGGSREIQASISGRAYIAAATEPPTPSAVPAASATQGGS
jgi:Tfp pilus assembly protein PilO